LYVARATSNQRVSVGISISSRVPAHWVSTGRVLLAALPQDLLHKYLRAMTLTRLTRTPSPRKVQSRGVIDQVRLQGWSIVDQELEVGASLAFGADPGRPGQDRRRAQRVLS
jgi:IclR family transcriptional regulator, pca regulon regulatory protein